MAMGDDDVSSQVSDIVSSQVDDLSSQVKLLNPRPRPKLLPDGRVITDRDRLQNLICRVVFCFVVALLTVGNAVLCSLPLFFDDNTEAPPPPSSPPPAGHSGENNATAADAWLNMGGAYFLPIFLRFSDEDLQALKVMARISGVQVFLLLLGWLCYRHRGAWLCATFGVSLPCAPPPPRAARGKGRKHKHERRRRRQREDDGKPLAEAAAAQRDGGEEPRAPDGQAAGAPGPVGSEEVLAPGESPSASAAAQAM